MSPQFKVALFRAILTAFVGGGLVFFTVISTTDLRAALIATGASVFGTLAARFGAEGTVDSAAAKKAEPPAP